MGKSLTRKIIEAHYVKGSMTPGEEVFIKVDQTLTHDINAVMTYLAFEAIGLPRVRTECSVSYLDHNLLYIDHKTPDDHIYLQSAAKKFGVWVSRPGNGICHAVQVARFGAPGKISMGGDSHTPHGGAIGMLCIGVGGMDVATAMTGVPMRLKMPRVVNVRLTGTLRPGVNAKEVILEMLRRVTIKSMSRQTGFHIPFIERSSARSSCTVTPTSNLNCKIWYDWEHGCSECVPIDIVLLFDDFDEVGDFLKEWCKQKKKLEARKITRAKYLEWMLLWPTVKENN